MKIVIFILLFTFYSPQTNQTIDAWNNGYEARWIWKKPKTSNPYKKNTKSWETWNDAWGYNGWMPNIIEK